LRPDRGIFTIFFRRLGNMPQLWVCVMLLPALFQALPSRAAEPVIDSLVASSTAIRPGETLRLTLDAHDPDCSDVCTSGCGMYLRADLTLWQCSGGSFTESSNGENSSPYTASATWQAPAEAGTYRLSVRISDSGTFMCGGRQNAEAEVMVEVDENAGQAPVISSFTIDENPVLAGMTVGVSVHAEDPQGDPLSYSFSALRGSIQPTSGGEAVYTAPGEAGPDTLGCTVRDPGGAAASAAIEITVTTALSAIEFADELVTPVGVAVNSYSDLAVADPGAGGLLFISPFSGRRVFEIPLPGIRCVASDSRGRLLVGTAGQILILSAVGRMEKVLDSGADLGPVSDIAVDPVSGCPVVLYGSAGRVVLFDQNDAVSGAFGSRGDAPEQFREAAGITVAATGEVLVSDAARGVVLRFSRNGQFLGNIGAPGNAAGELTRPSGVLQDRNAVFVSDAFQSRVAVFSPEGVFREFLGSLGEGRGHLRSPMGLCLLDQPQGLLIASAASSTIEFFRFDGQDTPPAPTAMTQPAFFDFGEVEPGESSFPVSLSLSNTGASPIAVYAFRTDGPFETTGQCPQGLQPGQHCTLETIFQPALSGRARGLLRFFTSAGESRVVLEGIGVEREPTPAVSPASLDFGTVLSGQNSEVFPIEISNSGGGEISVRGITIEGAAADQFEIRSDDCSGATLGAAENCVVALRFSPMLPGDHEALLKVSFEAPFPDARVDLYGEAIRAEAIPDLSATGIFTMILLCGLAGWLILGVKRRSVLLIAIILLGASTLPAVDPPHWYFGMDCSSCHVGHNAPGGGLTTATGNSNLCLSCHVAGGLAGALPILPSHTLSTHHYDVVPDAPRWGSAMPTNPEMANRIMDGKLVCSTCHDQHAAQASNRGLCRISTPEILTAFGSTGTLSVGGSYTGQGGSSYLIEITIADSHFRYSKDGGLSWAGEADTGVNVPLDSGLSLSFSGGSFALGERWRFSASFPFLRLPLDEGDNSSGDRYCRECHSLWAMDYHAVENGGSQWLSHPVGNGLGANGKGYDRTVPLDGNGVAQGGTGGDGNHSNDYALDAGGLVQCLSCHHIHYADSNTLTEDGP